MRVWRISSRVNGCTWEYLIFINNTAANRPHNDANAWANSWSFNMTSNVYTSLYNTAGALFDLCSLLHVWTQLCSDVSIQYGTRSCSVSGILCGLGTRTGAGTPAGLRSAINCHFAYLHPLMNIPYNKQCHY